jgi:hypothetical protein
MSKNGWTQERRLKQSEAIKSWKPWEKSTGAKTIEGKGKSKMNAYKHGGRGSELIRTKTNLNSIWEY